jgi:hypothetical protein
MAWPAPWQDNGVKATVIVCGEPVSVHPRIRLMLHEAADTFYSHCPDHSYLWIISRPAAIIKVSCATALCPREPASELAVRRNGQEKTTGATMLGKSFFYLLVTTVLALVLLGAASAVTHPGLLPEQLADYQGKFTPDQYEGRHWLRIVLLVPCALFSIVATASIFQSWRWAPVAYFVSAVLTMVAVEFLRPYVHPGSGEDYYELAIVLTAAVLLLLFFSPVRKWFLPVRHSAGVADSTDRPRD